MLCIKSSAHGHNVYKVAAGTLVRHRVQAFSLVFVTGWMLVTYLAAPFGQRLQHI